MLFYSLRSHKVEFRGEMGQISKEESALYTHAAAFCFFLYEKRDIEKGLIVSAALRMTEITRKDASSQ